MTTASIFDTFPTLETPRLRLRRILPSDAAEWLKVWTNPDVMRYLADFEGGVATLKDMNGLVAWADGIFARETGLRWAITLKPDDTLIGSCGFHLYSAANRCAEIGYELNRDFWRQGIMSEAVAAILRFGFGPMNLHRIEANVTEGNEGSAGLLRHLGFTYEGAWREREYLRGHWYDLWQFGLLEDEFHAV